MARHRGSSASEFRAGSFDWVVERSLAASTLKNPPSLHRRVHAAEPRSREEQSSTLQQLFAELKIDWHRDHVVEFCAQLPMLIEHARTIRARHFTVYSTDIFPVSSWAEQSPHIRSYCGSANTISSILRKPIDIGVVTSFHHDNDPLSQKNLLQQIASVLTPSGAVLLKSRLVNSDLLRRLSLRPARIAIDGEWDSKSPSDQWFVCRLEA